MLTPKLSIPVIGIGAGAATDGQVLVWHDLLGIYSGHAPKFVKRYANLRDEMIRGVSQYAREVRERSFPGPEHVYSIDPEELDAFRRYLEHEQTGRFRRRLGGDGDLTAVRGARSARRGAAWWRSARAGLRRRPWSTVR